MSDDKELFLSRELSWLKFNTRVLEEAENPANPVGERLKFLAITGSNLDEFFMVRVSGLRKLVQGKRDLPDPAGLHPDEQLQQILRQVSGFSLRQYRCLACQILPELEKQGVFLLDFEQLDAQMRSAAQHIFENKVQSVLTPRVVDRQHPFPLLTSGEPGAAIRLETPDKRQLYALVEIPGILEQFIRLPGKAGALCFLSIEELILAHLPELFAGCRVLEAFLFRMIRDMDLSICDDGAEDLLQSISDQLELRRRRGAIRLELQNAQPGPLREWLCRSLELEPDLCQDVEGFLAPRRFAGFARLCGKPELFEPQWLPAEIPELPHGVPVFDAVKKAGSILICPPFQHFSPVIRLLEEAAEDPQVLAIKQTLYRVSGNSPVVHALEKAARNGKKVTVIVELKARFDESNNIAWARELEESGAQVVYGIPGLKIHCKALLVIRRQPDGSLSRCVHLSTGNYNDKTASGYTDIGMMSAGSDLCRDVEKLFHVITGYTSSGYKWQKIHVSPFDLREQLALFIRRETAAAAAGKKAMIRAKMNSLSDEKIIHLLQEAAAAGVEIRLSVRGICCLRPRQEQNNLRIVSIVDRYLEHSRIFCFHNQGNPLFFLSSADWMTRNLDRRVEVMFPVEEEHLKQQLDYILSLQFTDDCKARQLRPDGSWSAAGNGKQRSQKLAWLYFKQRESKPFHVQENI